MWKSFPFLSFVTKKKKKRKRRFGANLQGTQCDSCLLKKEREREKEREGKRV